jgi:hypothetical protein
MLGALIAQGVAEQAQVTIPAVQAQVKRKRRMRFLMDKIKHMTKEQGEARQREIEQGVHQAFQRFEKAKPKLKKYSAICIGGHYAGEVKEFDPCRDVTFYYDRNGECVPAKYKVKNLMVLVAE